MDITGELRTWYRATSYGIAEKKIRSVGDKFVILADGSKQAIDCAECKWAETREQAKQKLIDAQLLIIDVSAKRLKRYMAELERLRGL